MSDPLLPHPGLAEHLASSPVSEPEAGLRQGGERLLSSPLLKAVLSLCMLGGGDVWVSVQLLLFSQCEQPRSQEHTFAFPMNGPFHCRPTPEEALKWGESLEKLLLHRCKCLLPPSPAPGFGGSCATPELSAGQTGLSRSGLMLHECDSLWGLPGQVFSVGLRHSPSFWSLWGWGAGLVLEGTVFSRDSAPITSE